MAGRDYTGTVIALGYTEKATGKGNMIFLKMFYWETQGSIIHVEDTLLCITSYHWISGRPLHDNTLL